MKTLDDLVHELMDAGMPGRAIGALIGEALETIQSEQALKKAKKILATTRRPPRKAKARRR